MSLVVNIFIETNSINLYNNIFMFSGQLSTESIGNKGTGYEDCEGCFIDQGDDLPVVCTLQRVVARSWGRFIGRELGVLCQGRPNRILQRDGQLRTKWVLLPVCLDVKRNNPTIHDRSLVKRENCALVLSTVLSQVRWCLVCLNKCATKGYQNRVTERRRAPLKTREKKSICFALCRKSIDNPPPLMHPLKQSIVLRSVVGLVGGAGFRLADVASRHLSDHE